MSMKRKKTLEQLIKECGHSFRMLTHHPEGWYAYDASGLIAKGRNAKTALQKLLMKIKKYRKPL